jgi:hypothetical protein
MANPDGVIAGNSSRNLEGKDLDKAYIVSDSESVVQEECKALESELIREYVQGRNVLMAFDLKVQSFSSQLRIVSQLPNHIMVQKSVLEFPTILFAKSKMVSKQKSHF